MKNTLRYLLGAAVILGVTSVALVYGLYIGRISTSQKPIVVVNVNQPVTDKLKVADVMPSIYKFSGTQPNAIINSQSGVVVIADAAALCGIDLKKYPGGLGEITSLGDVMYVREFSEGDAPPGALFKIAVNENSCVMMKSNSSFDGFGVVLLSPDKTRLAVADDHKMTVIDLAQDSFKVVAVIKDPETLSNYEAMGAVHNFKWVGDNKIEYSVYQINPSEAANIFLRTDTVTVE